MWQSGVCIHTHSCLHVKVRPVAAQRQGSSRTARADGAQGVSGFEVGVTRGRACGPRWQAAPAFSRSAGYVWRKDALPGRGAMGHRQGDECLVALWMALV